MGTMMNRGLAMELFENVHALQLERACWELKRPERRGEYWRIALRERCVMLHDEDYDAVADMVFYVVIVKLGRDGKLMVADEASQKAIDDWEQRNWKYSWEEFFAPAPDMIPREEDECH